MEAAPATPSTPMPSPVRVRVPGHAWDVPSRTFKPGEYFQVWRQADGTLACNCPATVPVCRHIREVLTFQGLPVPERPSLPKKPATMPVRSRQPETPVADPMDDDVFADEPIPAQPQPRRRRYPNASEDTWAEDLFADMPIPAAAPAAPLLTHRDAGWFVALAAFETDFC